MNHYETARKSALYLNLDELHKLNNQVVQYIKNEKAEQARRMKRQLSVGSPVSFEDNDGQTVQGKVAKVMRKFAKVETDGAIWRVPLSRLTKVSA